MKYGTVKPVWQGGRLWRRDRQQLPPLGWCVGCGGEVWQVGALCRRCRQKM